MLASIFALAFGLSSVYNGVDLSLGMAAQTQEGNPGRYQMVAPIGVLRLGTKPHQNFRLFAQHMSSIPDRYDQLGVNVMGAEITVHIGEK